MSFATEVAAKLMDSSNKTFESGEITTAVNDALRVFSRHKPREVTETLHTVSGSRLVDITPIEEDDLIFGYDERSFNSMYGVEYKVDQWNNGHRDYRNYNIFKDGDEAYIEMVLDNAPATSGLEVRVRTYQIWTESTLPAGYDDIVITYAAGVAASNKHMEATNVLERENTKFNEIIEALDELCEYIANADNISVDNVSARITAITDAISSAEGYYNKANVGQPEIEYIRSAGEQARATSEYLQQEQANLSIVNALLAKARAYGDLFRLKMQNAGISDKYLVLGNNYKAEAMAEMRKYSIDRTTRIWKTGT